MATSLDDAWVASAPAHPPAPLRIGLLGLGTVGSAVARLTREAAATMRARGVSPIVTAALVRDASRPRVAGAAVAPVTSDPGAFFSAQFDVVIEAIGGIEPARTLVAEALERGLPVVSANKTLLAAHGDALADLARRRGTALRYEASCVAGVPFIGTFERRPLASRGSGVTAILNGTSNTILSSLGEGATFADALADAKRHGLAEPDPTADVSGADAAQKLAILVRLFAARSVDWRAIPATPLSVLDPEDLSAARTFDARIKPIARASWSDRGVAAFVAPALVPDGHPLALVAGATNGVAFDGVDGQQCFIGPGAGPSATAATLLDDAVEIATDRAVRVPAAIRITPAAVSHPLSRWFLRVDCAIEDREILDLLGTFGVWCERLVRTGSAGAEAPAYAAARSAGAEAPAYAVARAAGAEAPAYAVARSAGAEAPAYVVVRSAADALARNSRSRRYVLTLPAPRAAIDEAAEALRTAARAGVLCLPALDGDARC